MPKFDANATERKPMVPEGDYILCVVDFSTGISQGAKTNGCENYEIEFEVEGQGARIRETLIDHPSCAWKISLFLKSCGVKLEDGKPFSFVENDACPFVDPMGLRCWARVMVESYLPKSVPVNASADERKLLMRQINKVATFYADKEKLAPKREVPAPETGDEEIPF